VPREKTVDELGRVPNASLGLMSAGIGSVPAEQTYLDISQGNRVDPRLYDLPLPQAGAWRRIRDRASSAPADIVPGLLGSALARARVPVQGSPNAGMAALLGVNESGRIARASARCDAGRVDHRIGGKVDQQLRGLCPGLTVLRARLGTVRALAANLRGRDLLVALTAPPPPANHFLPVAMAGAGYAGELTSDSTHVSGLVSSTDIAPTILERFGITAPDAMAGEAITSSGEADVAGLASLDARLAAIPGRRSLTIGTSLAAWAVGALLLAVALGRRWPRVALPLLAATVAWLPALLLLTAALEPSAVAETLIVALGAPALALITVGLAGTWAALAIAALVSVGGYAIDVLAGSHLVVRSLLGPNPAHGSRFYGIGNQLEAIIAPLVPIGVGAALTALRGRMPARRAALAFAVVTAVCVLAFAPGPFGADVGLAIDLPLGAAVAVLACLGETRPARMLAIVIAVPVLALACLAAIDLASGGDAHLTRSVLDAGGLQDLGQVAQRRLRLSADNFADYADSPLLWAAAAGILAGVIWRRRTARWFADTPYAWAGFLGAIAAAAAAVLVNDSGGLVLIIGTVPISLAAGIAWATGR
jgi:hypothetical protein